MIPIEAIRAVKRAVVHANCADGRASAVILKAALPDIEVVEVVHNSREHLTMPAEQGLLFCDFTPHPSRVAEFVKAGAIVLDHHKGAESIVRAFGERGVFADEKAEPGVSGAMLALWEVLTPLVMPSPSPSSVVLAHLVGIRDTWQRSAPEWDRACAVSSAVRFLPLDDALRRGPEGVMRFADEVGAILVRRQLDAAKEAAANAVQVTIDGRRVAIVSSVALTSDVADVLREQVDIVAGFDYVHEAGAARLQWSLRSRGDVDVSAIARQHGGNGHTAAAGFSVPVVSGEMLRGLSPYVMVHGLLRLNTAA